MKYLYIAFVSLITIAALVWVIQLGIQGKPIVKIKLSEFKSSNEVAESTLMRLRQELKDHSIVFFGLDPEEPEHFLIWAHLVKQAQEPGWRFDEVYVEKDLSVPTNLIPEMKRIDVKEKEAEFKSLWASDAYRGKRVAVIVPHIYASQLIQNNPVQRMKVAPEDGKILSISLVPLAGTPRDPELERLPCAAEGSDYTGKSPLGCAIRNKSMFWTKPLKAGVRLGVLEQFGLHDYLFFYRPVR
jgi:hypothetical protein